MLSLRDIWWYCVAFFDAFGHNYIVRCAPHDACLMPQALTSTSISSNFYLHFISIIFIIAPCKTETTSGAVLLSNKTEKIRTNE